MNDREWHTPYWLTFDGRRPACMEAATEEEAKRVGAELAGCAVVAIKVLPYPAEPRLRPFVHPTRGQMPSFCFEPSKCAGRTACPGRYSCTE